MENTILYRVNTGVIFIVTPHRVRLHPSFACGIFIRTVFSHRGQPA